MPSWWSSENNIENTRTITKMKEDRRKSNIPDPSYDLDGDGYVGDRDYVIAKIFDANNDGKLDAGEKERAMHAIKNVRNFLMQKGLEKQFFWGIEKSGSQRSFRVL
jgi:hypothetical protein